MQAGRTSSAAARRRLAARGAARTMTSGGGVLLLSLGSVDDVVALALGACRAPHRPAAEERAAVGAYFASLSRAGGGVGSGSSLSGAKRRAPGQHRRGPPRGLGSEPRHLGTYSPPTTSFTPPIGTGLAAAGARVGGDTATANHASAAQHAACELATRLVSARLSKGEATEAELARLLEFVLAAACGTGDAERVLAELEAEGAGGACGAEWGRDDVAYRCHTCAKDPTCAICVQCFMAGDHEGHDTVMLRTSGGCCDCGDLDAWEASGCCPRHRAPTERQALPAPLDELLPGALRGVMKVWALALLAARKDYAEALAQGRVVAEAPASTSSDSEEEDDNEEDSLDMDDDMDMEMADEEDLAVLEAMQAAAANAEQEQEQGANVPNTMELEGESGDDEDEEDAVGPAAMAAMQNLAALLPDAFALAEGAAGGQLWRARVSQASTDLQAVNEAVGKWLRGLCGRGMALLSAVADAMTEELELSSHRAASEEPLPPVTMLQLLLSVTPVAPAAAQGAVRALLYKLMAELNFKRAFAHALVDHYPEHAAAASADVMDAQSKRSAHLLDAFSVQIFTVYALVEELARDRQLLSTLLEAALSVLRRATNAYGLDLESAALDRRLYARAVEDFRYVIMAPPVGELAACDAGVLVRWMGLVASAQGGAEQTRKRGAHIEIESDAWISAYVLEQHLSGVPPLLIEGAHRAQAGAPGLLLNCVVAHLLRWAANVSTHEALTAACVVTARKEQTEVEGAAASVDDASPLALLQRFIGAHTGLHAAGTFEPAAVHSLMNIHGRLRGGAPVPEAIWSSLQQSEPCREEPLCSLVDAARAVVASGSGSGSAVGADTAGGLDSAPRPAQDGPPSTAPASISSMLTVVNSLIEKAASLARTDNCAPPDPWEEPEASDAALACIKYNPAAVARLQDLCAGLEVSSLPVSFHLPLHRLLAQVLKQSLDSWDGSAGSALLLLPAPFSEDAVLARIFGRIIAQHPLAVMGTIAATRAGLWRRNGLSFAHLAQLYTSAQWCEVGYELDLTLLQVAGCLMSGEGNGGAVLHLAARAFGLSGMLDGRVPTMEGGDALAQYLLELVMVLCKERALTIGTPEVPATASERMRAAVRREVVQRLAASDATHSQVQSHLPTRLKEEENSDFQLIRLVLEDVATFVAPDGMRPGHYKLRASAWDEFDLHHPRWHQSGLQSAIERYAAARGGNSAHTDLLPEWSPPPAVLASLADVTCSEECVVLAGTAMLEAHAEACGKAVVCRMDDATVTALRVLCLAGRAAEWRGPDAVQAIVGRLEKPRAWVGGDGLSEQHLSVFQIMAAIAAGQDDVAACTRAVLAALNVSLGTSVARGGATGTAEGSEESPAAEEEEQDAEERRAAMKARQVAAMAAMQAQQAAFLAQMEGMDTSSDEDEVAEEDEPGAVGTDEASAPVEEQPAGTPGSKVKGRPRSRASSAAARYECSLCRASAPSPMCRLALAQRSSIALHASLPNPSWRCTDGDSTKAAANDADGRPSPGCFTGVQREAGISTAATTGAFSGATARQTASKCAMRDTSLQWNHFGAVMLHQPAGGGSMAAYASTPPAKGSDADDTVLTGMHVSGCVVISCGHTFHSGCLESYCSTLLTRQTAVGAHAMEMGEFPCPVCRRLSNCMLPLPEAGEVKAGTTLSSLDGAVGTVGMESVDDAVGCLGGASELWGALAVAQTKHAADTAVQLAASAVDEEGGYSVESELLAQVEPNLADHLAARLSVVGDPAADLSPEAAVTATERVGSGDERATVAVELTLENTIVALEVASRDTGEKEGARAALEALAAEHARHADELAVLAKVAATHRATSPLARIRRAAHLRASFARLAGLGAIDPSLKLGMDRQSWNALARARDVVRQLTAGLPFIPRDLERAREALSVVLGVLSLSPDPAAGRSRIMETASAEDADGNRNELDQLARDPFASLCRASVMLCAPPESYGKDRPQWLTADAQKTQRQQAIAAAYVAAIVLALADSEALGPAPSHSQHLLSQISAMPPGKTATAVCEATAARALPFLRRAAVLHAVLGCAPLAGCSVAVERDAGVHQPTLEASALASFLGLPPPGAVLHALWAAGKGPSPDLSAGSVALAHRLVQVRLQGSHVALLAPSPAPRPLRLMTLPRSYEVLFQEHLKSKCDQCGGVPASPALCLLCGTLCCATAQCCARHGRRECSRHTLACGGGVGAFLLLRDTRTLLLRAADRRAVWGSLYLDSFGEEDTNRRRGKPLFLSEQRVARLTKLLATHTLEQDASVAARTMRDGRLM